MKTILTVSPREGLVAFRKCSKSAHKLIVETDFINELRKPISDEMKEKFNAMNEEEKSKFQTELGIEKIMNVLDLILVEEHIDTTIEFLANLFLLTPEQFEEKPLIFYIEEIIKLTKSKEVRGFLGL